MFERFTERARQVVVNAQDEARALKHNYIGTEHLLLGLLHVEDGAAAGVLAGLGVELDRTRAEVRRIVGTGDVARSGQIPFTPRAKKVLELALREALSFGHSYIGTEHVLLAVAREDEGVGAQILLGFGVDSDVLRAAVARTLGEITAVAVPPRPSARFQDRCRWNTTSKLVGWSLFALATGFGLLLGWLIWG